VRTVIAEDSVLFREGLARLLADAGHEIVAAVGDADALTSAVRKTRPDLAVVDIHMPPHRGADGARAARDLREDHPDLGIMLLSQHIETHATIDLIASGGFG
jgi:DNA-binding NarL/FixJ family response regulator